MPRCTEPIGVEEHLAVLLADQRAQALSDALRAARGSASGCAPGAAASSRASRAARARALCTAASTSAASAIGTLRITSPVDGLVTSPRRVLCAVARAVDPERDEGAGTHGERRYQRWVGPVGKVGRVGKVGKVRQVGQVRQGRAGLGGSRRRVWRVGAAAAAGSGLGTLSAGLCRIAWSSQHRLSPIAYRHRYRRRPLPASGRPSFGRGRGCERVSR